MRLDEVRKRGEWRGEGGKGKEKGEGRMMAGEEGEAGGAREWVDGWENRQEGIR